MNEMNIYIYQNFITTYFQFKFFEKNLYRELQRLPPPNFYENNNIDDYDDDDFSVSKRIILLT